MKKLTIFTLAIVLSSLAFGWDAKVDGIYYNLNTEKKTATVTHKEKVPSVSTDTYIGVLEIPSEIMYKGITYQVIAIDGAAFYDCTNLQSVIIPNTVKSIGGSAFYGCAVLGSVNIPQGITSIANCAFSKCQSLTHVIIPNSVTSIGQEAFCASRLKDIIIPSSVTSIGRSAFASCSNLTTVIIPQSVTKIESDAFLYCNQLQKVYLASSSLIQHIGGVSDSKIIRVPDEQLMCYAPYAIYVKDYVEKGINQWQQKGEFERTSDWQQRVNEKSRLAKIQSLLTEAQDKYIAFHVGKVNIDLTLGKYDPDNEVFSVSDAKYGVAYIAVPYNEAQDFKNSWAQKQVGYQMQMQDDEIKLASLSIRMPNGKTYLYRNTDAVNYNLTEVDYQFDPIELENLSSPAAPPKQGQQNVTTTKLKIGKSQVDTDIPVSGASNPNTFVVIIANEDYKNVAPVPFAKNDGGVFQKYCQKTLGVPVSNIHYVENATYNDLRIQLAWLKNVCEKFEGEASVIFYYTGHGIPDASDKSAYLLPVDGDGRYVQSAYKLDEFYEKLGSMRAKSITVLLDACFSGAGRDGKILSQAKGVALKSQPGTPQGKTVVFAAAQGDETAGFNDEEGHSMFTYYMLKCLQETKGNVTLQDLSQYVIREVGRKSAIMDKPQTPCVTASVAVGTAWQNWKLK